MSPIHARHWERRRKLARFFCCAMILLAIRQPALADSAATLVPVLTYHYDNTRQGANTNETLLTPANVNTNTFGKLFSYPLDGYVYAEPLIMTNLTIPGQGAHNVVFVATEHDTIYALDADSNSGPNGGVLWQTNLGSAAVSATAPFGSRYGRYSNIVPEVGITGTPVIDPATGTLYVDVFTQDVTGNATNFNHRIHALDVATGNERPYSPVLVAGSVPGTGVGSVNGVQTFSAAQHNQRPALCLANGNLIVTYTSFADTDPYHGWVFDYNATNLELVSVFNTTPNASVSAFGANAAEGGIWQGGGGICVDSNNNLYFESGNGSFSANTNGGDYADTFLKLSTTNGLAVADYFTPYDQAALAANDTDLGAGGPLLLPDSVGTTNHPHLMVGVGKSGKIYLVDRDNMGQFQSGSDSQIVESFVGIGGSWSPPAYWNNLLYFQPSSGAMKEFSISNASINQSAVATAPVSFGGVNGSPVVSANGTSNGIVWVLNNNSGNSGSPGALYAFNATNISQMLWSSAQLSSRDSTGPGIKMTTPTVAGGKVYVGGQYTLSVYGIALYLAAPVIMPGGGVFTNSVMVTISNTAPGALIYYTTDGTTPTSGSTLYTGPFTVTTTENVQAIAVEAGYVNSAVASASFVSSLNLPPPPWQTSDIGSVGVAGSAYFSNGVFIVSGSGADIQGTSDAFRFVYQTTTGDCTNIARVTSVQNVNVWSKAGIMIRNDLSSSAANAYIALTPGNGVTWQWRPSSGANGASDYNDTSGLNAPYWVKLVRIGNTFTGYRSSDGVTWTPQGTNTFTLSSTAYVGLAVTSHDNANLATATFDNVTVNSITYTNPPPQVALTAPTENSSYTAAASVTISADADALYDTVDRVDFYANSAFVGSVSNVPYSATATGLGAGSYALTAVAVSSSGLVSTSAPVSITVAAGTGQPYGLTNREIAPAFFNMSATFEGSLPPLLSETGVFSNTPSMTPAGGLIPYSPNVALWSDGAVKTRYMAVPDDGGAVTPSQQIAFASAGSWTFPAGTVFVKTFQLNTDTSNPNVLHRLETRLLVRDINGAVYGVTYKWRPDNSDADLLSSSLYENITITNSGGILTTQTWYYPSPSDCLQCHTPVANYVLGVNTRQLNRDQTYAATGVTDNQIRTLNRLGLFNPAFDETNVAGFEKLSALTNTGASFEDRARSYLDANCAQCHQPGGAGITFDARYDTPLTNQNLIYGALDPDGEAMIVPRDIWRSQIHQRMDTTNPVIRMPPLARQLIDSNAVAVLEGWINSLPGTPALAPVAITPEGGLFFNNVGITMQSPATNTAIYYTLDGTLPTTNSMLYSGVVGLTSNAMVSASAFETNYINSLATSGLFFVQPVRFLSDYFTNGIFQLQFLGAPGSNYVLQASTDLVNWTPMITNPATTNGIIFIDPEWSNYPMRFYRATQQ
jgi:regulation of enolase protein 1 (concanavalin A-like superfamily)